MPKGFCAVCQERHEITPTDEPVGPHPQGGDPLQMTARKWRVVAHRHPGAPPDAEPSEANCAGSGTLI